MILPFDIYVAREQVFQFVVLIKDPVAVAFARYCSMSVTCSKQECRSETRAPSSSNKNPSTIFFLATKFVHRNCLGRASSLLSCVVTRGCLVISYESRFKSDVRASFKDAKHEHRTMGYADEPVPDPQQYLKKQVNAAPTRKTPFVRYMTRSERNPPSH